VQAISIFQWKIYILPEPGSSLNFDLSFSKSQKLSCALSGPKECLKSKKVNLTMFLKTKVTELIVERSKI
jgi:hypothetical protein